MSNKDWEALAQLTTTAHCGAQKHIYRLVSAFTLQSKRVSAILTRPLASISHVFFWALRHFSKEIATKFKRKNIVAERNEKNWKTSCTEQYKIAKCLLHLYLQGKGRKSSPLVSCFSCWGPTSHSIPRRREIQVNKVLQRCAFIFEQNINWVSSLVSLWPTVTQNMSISDQAQSSASAL